MDLSLVHTHLENFVDTWEGWSKIAGNLGTVFNTFANLYFGYANDEFEIADFFTNTSSALGSSK